MSSRKKPRKSGVSNFYNSNASRPRVQGGYGSYSRPFKITVFFGPQPDPIASDTGRPPLLHVVTVSGRTA